MCEKMAKGKVIVSWDGLLPIVGRCDDDGVINVANEENLWYFLITEGVGPEEAEAD